MAPCPHHYPQLGPWRSSAATSRSRSLSPRQCSAARSGTRSRPPPVALPISSAKPPKSIQEQNLPKLSEKPEAAQLAPFTFPFTFLCHFVAITSVTHFGGPRGSRSNLLSNNSAPEPLLSRAPRCTDPSCTARICPKELPDETI
jgi:hypothetical protein